MDYRPIIFMSYQGDWELQKTLVGVNVGKPPDHQQ